MIEGTYVLVVNGQVALVSPVSRSISSKQRLSVTFKLVANIRVNSFARFASFFVTITRHRLITRFRRTTPSRRGGRKSSEEGGGEERWLTTASFLFIRSCKPKKERAERVYAVFLPRVINIRCRDASSQFVNI